MRRTERSHLAWVRAFYRELFAESGGVAGPALNTSGVPWHTLYYQGTYPRLQRIKARYDPQDVFRHTLSIRRQ
jgi:aclacinomycin oxidase